VEVDLSTNGNSIDQLMRVHCEARRRNSVYRNKWDEYESAPADEKLIQANHLLNAFEIFHSPTKAVPENMIVSDHVTQEHIDSNESIFLDQYPVQLLEWVKHGDKEVPIWRPFSQLKDSLETAKEEIQACKDEETKDIKKAELSKKIDNDGLFLTLRVKMHGNKQARKDALTAVTDLFGDIYSGGKKIFAGKVDLAHRAFEVWDYKQKHPKATFKDFVEEKRLHKKSSRVSHTLKPDQSEKYEERVGKNRKKEIENARREFHYADTYIKQIKPFPPSNITLQ